MTKYVKVLKDENACRTCSGSFHFNIHSDMHAQQTQTPAFLFYRNIKQLKKFPLFICF